MGKKGVVLYNQLMSNLKLKLMKKSLFSKLAIMLMAICFCSNVWADEIITLKFTVRDEGGFYLKNTFVSAVSDTPDKCEISNPTGFVDDQATKGNAGNTKGVRNFPDYSHIQLHGCYSNQSSYYHCFGRPGNRPVAEYK